MTGKVKSALTGAMIMCKNERKGLFVNNFMPFEWFCLSRKTIRFEWFDFVTKNKYPRGGGLTNREANDKCIKRCFAPSMDR